jgi:hypothetical protein
MTFSRTSAAILRFDKIPPALLLPLQLADRSPSFSVFA